MQKKTSFIVAASVGIALALTLGLSQFTTVGAAGHSHGHAGHGHGGHSEAKAKHAGHEHSGHSHAGHGHGHMQKTAAGHGHSGHTHAGGCGGGSGQ